MSQSLPNMLFFSQVDVFGLKDLAPQKFRSTGSAASMEVYSVVRLVRNGVKRSEGRKAWADTMFTPAKKVSISYNAL